MISYPEGLHQLPSIPIAYTSLFLHLWPQCKCEHYRYPQISGHAQEVGHPDLGAGMLVIRQEHEGLRDVSEDKVRGQKGNKTGFLSFLPFFKKIKSRE